MKFVMKDYSVINTLAYIDWVDICVLALSGRDCFISLFIFFEKENGNELK